MRFKNYLAFCLLAIMVLGLACFAEAREATAVQAEKAPDINGQLDDAIWAKAVPVEYKDPNGVSDTVVTMYFAWDSEYFYWAFKVVDDDFFGFLEDPDTYVWNNDDVEWYIETDNAKATKRTDKTFQLCIGVAGGYNFTAEDPVKINQDPKSKMAFTYDGSYEDEDPDKYWIVEGKTPWRVLKVEPKKGMTFGFSSTCFDRRFDGNATAFFGWTENININNNHTPAEWGTLVLN